MSLRLSVLDQSPVIGTIAPSEAIQQSMELVQRADSWGYHRYWFAEHHNTASFASAQPPTMIAHAAALTSRIRLGSGGMLVGNHNPLLLAETFRSLDVLSKGRVDLGMGRAPGGDQRVMESLRYKPGEAAQIIDETLQLLQSNREPSSSHLAAVPSGGAGVQPWVLGTSIESAKFAADKGLPYAFGSFIDPTRIAESLATYHQHFVPSVWSSEPYSMIATVVFCADTTSEAQHVSKCSERWFVKSFLRGENVRFPSADEEFDPTAQEQIITAMRRHTVIIGDKDLCAEQLYGLQKRFACNEIAVVTITEQHQQRLRSYELLAELL